MKTLLDKLHARLGDFWWYSLMVFCAARVADGKFTLIDILLRHSIISDDDWAMGKDRRCCGSLIKTDILY